MILGKRVRLLLKGKNEKRFRPVAGGANRRGLVQRSGHCGAPGPKNGGGGISLPDSDGPVLASVFLSTKSAGLQGLQISELSNPFITLLPFLSFVLRLMPFQSKHILAMYYTR